MTLRLTRDTALVRHLVAFERAFRAQAPADLSAETVYQRAMRAVVAAGVADWLTEPVTADQLDGMNAAEAYRLGAAVVKLHAEITRPDPKVSPRPGSTAATETADGQ